MKNTSHIVIAEDDEFVQQLLAAYLQNEGYRISLAVTGRELLATLDSESPDLILLDLGLPDEDGLVLMRQIRARSTIPIVVLTARQEQDDRISALELGADDYLTKPCNPRELVLRVKNLLNRNGSKTSGGKQQGATSIVQFNGWQLNLAGRSLHNVQGSEVHLSRSEFNILAALAKAPNRVLTRGQLLDSVSQHDTAPSERMIDVVVSRLRQKIEVDAKRPQYIRTMVGVGYKFSLNLGTATPS